MSAAKPVLPYEGSVISLVLANLVAITIARYYDMSLHDLIFVYWLQGVIMGVAHAVRMLCLKDYSKAGYVDKYGRPIDTSGLGKVNFALQFVFAYGFIHAIVFAFVAVDIEKQGLSVPPLGELFACGLVFAADQLYSTAKKITLDRQGRPHIGGMMGAPFVRIFPMYVTILVGGLSFGRDVGALWWLFAGLKTIVDVVMHVRERRSIQDAIVAKREMDEALARLALPLQEAVAWYREGAEKGEAAAQLNLGKVYLEGRGVSQSNAEALKWLRKAAEQANPDAAALIAEGARSGRW